MDSYLTNPAQRLAVLSRRYQEKTEAASFVRQVQRSYKDHNLAASIVRGITIRECRRQEEFSNTMSRLGAEREELAYSLTDTLSCVEKQTKMFLIKPIFSRPHMHSPNLITPLPRPLPIAQSVPPSKTEHRPHTVGCRPSSSNVRMIQTFLQSRRQQDMVNPQDLIDGVNAASKWNFQGRPQ
jgi:hypothetical protein